MKTYPCLYFLDQVLRLITFILGRFIFLLSSHSSLSSNKNLKIVLKAKIVKDKSEKKSMTERLMKIIEMPRKPTLTRQIKFIQVSEILF